MKLNTLDFSMFPLLFLCLLKRSDDDDRSSDRKDGALEEQIERLQEKVESAQSEQKNLFLVIFQVTRLGNQCISLVKIILVLIIKAYSFIDIQECRNYKRNTMSSLGGHRVNFLSSVLFT